MSDFDYSVDALNVKNAFLDVKTIIYVEGDDDAPFWHEIFSKIPDFQFEVESMGGSSELDKYIKLIEKGELEAIAARDSDYLFFSEKMSENPKVVYTRGYSIENTLYTPNSVHALAKVWCKAPTLEINVCEEWINSFSCEFKDLLIKDIANFCEGTGLQVLHDNCTQFMVSEKSSLPCKLKIDSANNLLLEKFPQEILDKVEGKFDKTPAGITLTIRGHFFASAVPKFIARQAALLRRRISVSNEGLYAAAFAYFLGNFDGNHPHYDHYINSASAAVESL